jgi:translation initiation factor 2 alpha subunit (eIF-2alpha)
MEVGDLVSCVVDRIVGTVVFVKILGQNSDLEGSIVFSEVAPGRIRNIRDYIVPKKKIVCKILRISNNNIDLSFRRVSQKERKEVLEGENLEKSYASILKSVVGEDTEKILKKINEKESLLSLFEEAK